MSSPAERLEKGQKHREICSCCGLISGYTVTGLCEALATQTQWEGFSMDDTTHFLELSALLTGLYNQLLNDPEDRTLIAPIAEEYTRRLYGTFPAKLPALLEAYKNLATAKELFVLMSAIISATANPPLLRH